MNIKDLIDRSPEPLPWSEGDNIPWNDPGFSERMLWWHLSQESDAASRRTDKIERHVAWIHRQLLGGRATKILDLGCGPGLYSNRLGALGHTCAGIDFSPASVRYATQHAHPSCTFTCADIRGAEYGAGYGMAMLIYGELNVFKPADVHRLLDKIHAALLPGGILLLEPGTYAYTESAGRRPANWYTSPGGLFSARPHLLCQEHFWDATTRTNTTRHFVIDAETGEVTRFATSQQAYTDDELIALLGEHGFSDVAFYPSLSGVADESQTDFLVVVATKA